MAGEKSDAKSTGRPLDATGEAVRRNIRRIRDERGISAPELSQRLDLLGRPIPPLGISRIENGQRRVDVDDLVAIAVALRVSPPTLLMPARKSDGSVVEARDLVPIAGWQKPITASLVWDWLSGDRPLIGTTSSDVAHILDPERWGATLGRLRFGELAWPAWVYREEAEEIETLRQRQYEQGQAEMTGQTRQRKRASQMLREIRAEREDAGSGDDQ